MRTAHDTHALAALLDRWQQRSRDSLPVDAMLINKHIRELSEAFGTAAPLTPAPAQADSLRVACITIDGTTLTVPADTLGAVLSSDDEPHVWCRAAPSATRRADTLSFKTMPRAEFDALGEFNGF